MRALFPMVVLVSAIATCALADAAGYDCGKQAGCQRDETGHYLRCTPPQEAKRVACRQSHGLLPSRLAACIAEFSRWQDREALCVREHCGQFKR